MWHHCYLDTLRQNWPFIVKPNKMVDSRCNLLLIYVELDPSEMWRRI